MVIPAAGGKRVFVSNSDSDSLAVIDLATGKTRWFHGRASAEQRISHDGKRLYLTNTNANQISILDTDSLRVTGTITTGKGPARVALTPDAKTLVL
jgi:YVTN family beta-propeller protein